MMYQFQRSFIKAASKFSFCHSFKGRENRFFCFKEQSVSRSKYYLILHVLFVNYLHMHAHETDTE